jgi:hypothetical protein
MPRKCTVCVHKKRSAIDQALVDRRAFRDIARQFQVSKDALVRHSDDHLPASLVKAQEAKEAADADALLAKVVDYQDRAIAILDKAEAVDDFRNAISALREARGCTELLAKLAGELKDAPIVNLVLSPEWLTVQVAILTALEPHPEARSAVAHALGRIDCAASA